MADPHPGDVGDGIERAGREGAGRHPERAGPRAGPVLRVERRARGEQEEKDRDGSHEPQENLRDNKENGER